MDRPPKLLTWNADGVRLKRTELMQFITEFDTDIVLLQETHLRPTDNFTIPNYIVYRTDRPNQQLDAPPAGGTAILVHRRVPHRQMPCPGPAMETTTICVGAFGSELSITSLYLRPPLRVDVNELDSLLAPDNLSIVAGDFNAKHGAWGCVATSASGRHLLRFLDARPHVSIAAPQQPTHYPLNPNHRADILDFALFTGLPTPLSAEVVSDLSSDHLPVLLRFEMPVDPHLPPPIRRKINWIQYHNFLSDRQQDHPPPAQPCDIDKQVLELKDTINRAMDHCSTTSSGPRANHKQLPPHLMEEIKTRRRLRREWQRTRYPRDKTAFNAQCLKVKNLLQDHKDTAWRDFVSSLDLQDGSIWRLVKSLKSQKPATRPLHGEHGLVYDLEDKCRTFADSLEDQFSPHADIYDDDHIDRVEAYLEAMDKEDDLAEEDPVALITVAELSQHLTRLKPRKAPGPDSIPALALKNLPRWVLEWIATILNACLHLCHFPGPWKSAKVILIPKPGKDTLFPENHRPISLLPTLSKVLERIVLSRFPQAFHSTIRDEQFGFRRGHSTTLQLARVITHIADNFNWKKSTATCLLDVSKAFDKVWHDGLLYKLARSPLPKRLFYLLQSYLEDRRFVVSVGSASSTARPVTAGVPQGSVLGPILYLWYTNDIPLVPNVTLSLYADDAMFMASSRRPQLATQYLQRQLDTLEPWLERWRIKVNPDKSEAICFSATPSYAACTRDDVTLFNTPIPWKKTVKYLGLTLNRTLTTTPTATKRLNLAKAAYWNLSSLFGRTSPLSIRTKLQLYTMGIRPIFTYASPAWYGLTAPSTRKKLEQFQSKCLRHLTGSPWFVKNEAISRSAGVSSVAQVIDGLTTNLVADAANSEWRHVRRLVTQPGPPERTRRRPLPTLDDPP